MLRISFGLTWPLTQVAKLYGPPLAIFLITGTLRPCLTLFIDQMPQVVEKNLRLNHDKDAGNNLTQTKARDNCKVTVNNHP